mgnify:FL=1
MQDLRKLVHSPHHLFVFEVCGRLLSFTRAASEMGVSQPAVSLAIRQMEQAIGQALFYRGHRQITLTPAGERLYADVSNGLGRILRTAQDIHRGTRPRRVTLSISTAFANHWVMPRLSRFHQTYPGIDLRLQVVDRDIDLENQNVSLGIRRGRGNWQGYDSACIAHEKLLPVASSFYLQSNGRPDSVESLLQHRHSHLEEPFRPRPTWQDWFQAMGTQYIDTGKGLRRNDYALVIQAALSGEGVAIGWWHIVQPLIKSGLLSIALDRNWVTGEEFHLIWSSRTTLSDPAQQLRDWLINEAQVQSA